MNMYVYLYLYIAGFLVTWFFGWAMLDMGRDTTFKGVFYSFLLALIWPLVGVWCIGCGVVDYFKRI